MVLPQTTPTTCGITVIAVILSLFMASSFSGAAAAATAAGHNKKDDAREVMAAASGGGTPAAVVKSNAIGVGALTAADRRRLGARLKYKGMTFTNERYCPNVTMGSARSWRSLAHLATTGTDTVAIVVTQYQMNVTATEIFPVPEDAPIRCTATPTGFCSTVSDSALVATIQYVQHTLGMRVFLKAHIDLIDDPPHWRGDIGTGMTPDQWRAWFDAYTQFITHYAAIAEANAVALFAVSTELVVPSLQAPYWRSQVIPAIRSVYRGRLTDAANWSPPGPIATNTGGEVDSKTWWDLVDVIGIDEYYMKWAYSTVDGGALPTLSQLLALWEPLSQSIQALHATYNKSIIFTEMGYCSGVGARCFANGKGPVPSPATTPASLDAQVAQYDAALLTMASFPWFEGIFWWNWATDDAFGGLNNSCMDIKFKPTETRLREWYGATQPQPSPPAYPPICECWL